MSTNYENLLKTLNSRLKRQKYEEHLEVNVLEMWDVMTFSSMIIFWWNHWMSWSTEKNLGSSAFDGTREKMVLSDSLGGFYWGLKRKYFSFIRLINLEASKAPTPSPSFTYILISICFLMVSILPYRDKVRG